MQALLHASTAATAYSVQHYVKLAKPLVQCPSLQQAFHTMALALDKNTYAADPDLVETIYNQMCEAATYKGRVAEAINCIAIIFWACVF